MKAKKIRKIIIDTAMLILLPLLMAYSLIGETAHEWLGLTMFLLFILHHIMNPAWLKTLFKGRYTPLRIYLTGVNVLLLIVMVLQPVSGIMMSKHIFHFFRRRRDVLCPNGSSASVPLGICPDVRPCGQSRRGASCG